MPQACLAGNSRNAPPTIKRGAAALLPGYPVVGLSRLQQFADLSPIGGEGTAAPKATTADNVTI
jgi:hypothetical protein